MPFEETEDFIHWRFRSPSEFDPHSFRVITLSKRKGPNAVKATIGCPTGNFAGGRCQVGTKTQKIMFPKPRFTKTKAKAWIKRQLKRRLKKRRKKKKRPKTK